MEVGRPTTIATLLANSRGAEVVAANERLSLDLEVANDVFNASMERARRTKTIIDSEQVRSGL